MTQTKQKNQSVWSKFTHQYSLSKTLRFELKPVGKTMEFLKQNKVFTKDQTIDDCYNQAKFYFDKLHQGFINEALSRGLVRNLNFDDLASKFNKFREEITKLRHQKTGAEGKNDKQKIQKKIRDIENKVRDERGVFYKKIKKILDRKAEQWKDNYQKKGLKFSKTDLSQKGMNFLMKKGVLEILKHEFPKEKNNEFVKKGQPSLFVDDKSNPSKKVYIFNAFDSFSTYLTKFQETRKNLYKDDGTSTSVATRVVSNFEIFLKNKSVFDEKYKNWKKKIGLNNSQIRIFDIDYYYNCLIQKGINEYNKILGEINKTTKKYRDGNKVDKKDLPLFKGLEKQILGEVRKERELIAKTETKTEEQVFVERFQEFIKNNKERISKAKGLIHDFFSGKFDSEYDSIYLRRPAVNTIAYKWFESPVQFLGALPQVKGSKKRALKVEPFISLLDIKNALKDIKEDVFKSKYYKDDKNNRAQNKNDDRAVLERNSNESRWQQFLKVWKCEFDGLFRDKFNGDEQIFWGYTNELEEKAEKLSSFRRKKEEIALIKNYSDAVLRIYRMMKYFALEAKNEKDIPSDYSSEFYSRFGEYYKDFEFIRYYNAIRNFVTKKPSNEDKIKLNFEKSNLLGGWAESPKGNAQFCGYILKKNDKYYLGVTNDPKILDNNKYPQVNNIDKEFYEKMDYKQLKSQTIYGSIYKGKFRSEYKKDKNRLPADVLIKRIKSILQEQQQFFPDLQQVIDAQYTDPKELAKDINNIDLYNLAFKEKISAQYVDQGLHIDKTKHKTNKKYLYLFQIYNKDFSEKAKGRKNIHTLYFLNLFSKDNMENPVLKLNGNAEIFYRKASQPIEKEKIGKKGREITKYKRYTEDKILFHFPIEINYREPNIKQRQFNKKINEFIVKDKNNINIIGIDRGEKNLLYYCVIDKDQNILDYGSFNEINGVNYFEKLLKRERERLKNRQSWKPVVQIKDLKKGYLSYVIRKIADLAIQYNALIVLEDLNFRFKQIRGGIERSVYQQFEKALIDKLGYLIFKDKTVNEPGGVMNGYQLVAPFTSFQKIGKQTGIIFYTDAEYTSKTDPLTGFRKNIYISNSASNKKVKDLIKKLKAIGWDEKEQSYHFTYNQKDFEKDNKNRIDKEWTIYAKVKRIRREQNENGHWDYKEIDVNQKLEDLFKAWKFTNPKSQNLKEEIIRKENELAERKEFDSKKNKKRNFYQAFIYLFNLILDVRNQLSLHFDLDKKEIDYGADFFASPVKPFFTTLGVRYTVKLDEEGNIISKFIKNPAKDRYTEINFSDFASRFKTEKVKNQIKYPFDSDGVGAYNIARKGILMLQKIVQNPERPELAISRKEWDEFVQKA